MATSRTPGTRAKDSDRTSTCQVLDNALAEGQLSMGEHQQRVNAAVNAATLGELQSLVDDLQTSGPASAPVPSNRRLVPIVFAVITGIVVLICGAVAWALMADDQSRQAATPTSASPSAEAPHSELLATTTAPPTTSKAPDEVPAVVLTPPTQLQTAEGMTALLDEMRKRFGDTTGYELAVMEDQALLARTDPQDDGQKLIYTFRTGWGDPSTRSRSDTDDVTDLGAFDVAAAAAALQAAPETLKIAPGDVSETFIDVDHIADPAGPGALELLIKVTTTSGADGFIYLDGAGNIKRVENPS